MEQEIIETLKGIGLTDGEARVYAALITLGTSTVGPIIDKSGISSSKAYIILERLVQKGLVSMIVEKGNKRFTANDPEQIMEYLDEEEQRIETHRKNVKKIMPILSARRNSASNLPIVEITKGDRGFFSFQNEMISKAKEGDIKITLAGKRMGFKMQAYWYEQSLLLNKKKIKDIITYDHDLWYKKDPGIHKRKERKLYYPKVLDEKFKDLPNFHILGNNVLISDMDEEGKVFTLMIRNKNLTNAFRSLMELIRDAGHIPEGFETKE